MKLNLKFNESKEKEERQEQKEQAETAANSIRDEGVEEAVWIELMEAQKRDQEEQERIKREQEEAIR